MTDVIWTWETNIGYSTRHLLPPDPGEEARDDRWFCGPRPDLPGPVGTNANSVEPWPAQGCKNCRRAYLAWANQRH